METYAYQLVAVTAFRFVVHLKDDPGPDYPGQVYAYQLVAVTAFFVVDLRDDPGATDYPGQAVDTMETERVENPCSRLP